MTSQRPGGTAGMGLTGLAVNRLLQRAQEAAESVAGDPVADEVDGELHAPDGALCTACGGPLLKRQNTRRGPAGLRHESCP